MSPDSLCGQAAKDLELTHNCAISQACKEQTDKTKQAQNEALEATLTDASGRTGILASCPVMAAKYFFMCAIKDKLKDHMIHHTSCSLKNDGQPINTTLPSKMEVFFMITLKETKMAELMQELAHVSKSHGNFAMFAFEVISGL